MYFRLSLAEPKQDHNDHPDESHQEQKLRDTPGALALNFSRPRVYDDLINFVPKLVGSNPDGQEQMLERDPAPVCGSVGSAIYWRSRSNVGSGTALSLSARSWKSRSEKAFP